MESKITTDVLSNVLSQLQALTASVDLFVEGQSSMNKTLYSLSNRVEAIEQSTKSNAGEISKIKDDYNKLVEGTNEISLVQAKTQSQVQKLEDATKSIPGVEAGIANPENTVVIYGLPETHQEDIYAKVHDMFQCMQKDYTKLTETVRLKSYVNRKPGVVKASFSSVTDKVDILRAKQRLKGTQYGKVFIRSSKNHAEHLAEINNKIILENSSWGKDYKLTSNGRLIQKALLVASSIFFYLEFYVAFNTVQVISRQVFGRAEETSTYSLSGFCTVKCRPTANNYQLSHLRPCREPNPSLRGGRQEFYHSATVAPRS